MSRFDTITKQLAGSQKPSEDEPHQVGRTGAGSRTLRSAGSDEPPEAAADKPARYGRAGKPSRFDMK